MPDPDSIFVGGSGRHVVGLISAAYERLPAGGRLVVTMTSIDHAAAVHQSLRSRCPDVKVWMLNFARGNYQLDCLRFESATPTFLTAVVKPAR